jgi:quinol-cytochrome oxidoreductase complex cytochrome b subunit
MTEKKESMIARIMNSPQPLPNRVPDYMRKKGGAWYWTGAFVMFAFFYEVITGLILLFYYQPSNAYVSTTNIAYSLPYGSIILTTHLYGAYAMIVAMYIHLLRNLFVAGYKKPREQQWLTGLLLLLLTLGAGFFGYSMSGDVLSIDATDVGRGIAAGFPYLGGYLRDIFFGNGTSISLFSRMLGWHIILAASIGVLFALHFFMAEYNTIMPSGKQSHYRAPAIDHADSTYKLWYPYNMVYMLELMFFSFAIIVLIPSILAILPGVPALFSPFPQVAPTSPLASTIPAYPPWFLLFVYKELDFKFSQTMGPFWATVLFVGMPLIYLLLVPKFDAGNTLKLQDRPTTVSLGILGIVYLAGLSAWGALEPGVPISTIDVLVFFMAPAFIVITLTFYIASRVRSNSIKMKNAISVYITLVVTAFSLFGDVMIIYNYIKFPSMTYLAALVVLLAITVISLVVAVAFAMEKLPRDSKIGSPLIGRKGHLLAGTGFAFAAIVILSMISVITPSNSYNNSLYGIGLGVLLILVGGIIRLYRSTELGE